MDVSKPTKRQRERPEDIGYVNDFDEDEHLRKLFFGNYWIDLWNLGEHRSWNASIQVPKIAYTSGDLVTDPGTVCSVTFLTTYDAFFVCNGSGSFGEIYLANIDS